MENLRDCSELFVYREGEVTIGNYEVSFLPPEVFYKQLNKIKANGEKTFKPLDKAPPKRNCPLHNFLVLNERFHKVMTKCLLPEDFGLVEFSQEFMDGIGIGHNLETGSDMRLLWTRVTSAFRTCIGFGAQTAETSPAYIEGNLGRGGGKTRCVHRFRAVKEN